MTIDEAIKRYNNNAEHERTHGNLQGCLKFKQLAGWLKDYKRLLEREKIDKTVKAILIPEGATNGDMLMAMFPNLRVTICSEAKPIPCVMVIGENYEFNNMYPLSWWDAPYKKEVEEGNV